MIDSLEWILHILVLLSFDILYKSSETYMIITSFRKLEIVKLKGQKK